MRTQLLIIDPQNDFCDLPATRCPLGETPALPVTGADADLRRLAALIDAAADRIDQITVTLDSHQRLDIAHPGFWCTGSGAAVAPFTTITAAQLHSGTYRPRDPASLARAQAYVDALEARGRYALMVWPVHCEIGSWGQAVHADVRAAYNRWEERHLRAVLRVSKGANAWTEHYSALQAEVPDPEDASTGLDQALLARLATAGRLLVAGQASSHCVRATVEDLIEHAPELAACTVLLSDCMSPVAGFESKARDFLGAMRARGLQVTSSVELASLLQAAA